MQFKLPQILHGLIRDGQDAQICNKARVDLIRFSYATDTED
jgi:hypothetical protein